ncbi:MAG: galactarate dehydratase [Bryobacteraceae bacterium]|nr:galactarate dehydratase [Bryobacteraceae bacterium]
MSGATLIRVHPLDNVAVAAAEEGLPAGTPLEGGAALREFVPAGHKVALEPIPQGGEVRRYGAVIGRALCSIEAGARVREEMLELPQPPPLDKLCAPHAPPPELEPLEGFTFDGYRNADGTVGTRNVLAITTTVQCVAAVVEHAAARIRRELLPRYANVDGVAALTHAYGCGVAIDAPNSEIPIRTVRNLALNPNFGGELLVVSLGCEKLEPQRLELPSAELPLVRLQEAPDGSFEALLGRILELAEQRLERLNARRRVPCPASGLVVGLQCGGSDAFSGITANPAVGFAADLLVRAGATVIFSEITEVRDAAHLLAARAASADVVEDLRREFAWYDAYLARGGADRSANPTPGNRRGGLVNVVEKALGSVAKSGRAPLAGVIAPGERAARHGLLFLAGPASDFICGTLELAAGMNVHVFTTGLGTPYGLPACPVIKVSTRTSLARRWPDLIDFDAGPIATGGMTLEEAGWALFRLILDTASGRRTWTERHGLENSLVLFNPAPVT